MDGWIMVGVVAVSLASIMIYMVLMFFFPEWVGITGAVAKKAIESHVENRSEDPAQPPHS